MPHRLRKKIKRKIQQTQTLHPLNQQVNSNTATASHWQLNKLPDLITNMIIYGYALKTCPMITLFNRTDLTLNAQKEVLTSTLQAQKRNFPFNHKFISCVCCPNIHLIEQPNNWLFSRLLLTRNTNFLYFPAVRGLNGNALRCFLAVSEKLFYVHQKAVYFSDSMV